jgi:uncharacterized protein
VVSKSRSGTGRRRDAGAPTAAPLGERDIAHLQALLDAVPAPLEPLDLSTLDGFLCGVLVQPEPVAPARWLPFVTDIDGRALPAGFDAGPIHALVRRRADELRRAIERRTWFDPWVFELDVPDENDDALDDDFGAAGEEADEGDQGDDGARDAALAAVLPWAAGCTAALETFPALLGADDGALTAPLALLYRHVGTDTLEDVDALRAEVETLAAPADLAEAVEELVRATLLLADVAGLRAQR